MAASSANKMEIPAPNWDLLQTNLRDDQVQWGQVREYLYQRFTSPPSSFLNHQGRTLVSNVEPQDVCEHIRRFRPCPSFWDPSTTCNRYHPEFLLRGGRVIWTPRTWACHAFQRRTDHHRHGTCQLPGCMQLHRPGWEHTELYAFRLWMRQSNSRLWFSVWHELPNIDGKKPLWTLKYQDVHECLTTQPFLEFAEYDKQDWQCEIPSPLTYIQDVHSRVQPLEPNWNDPERVQRRREFRRSLTPRSTTPRRPRDDQPAQPAQPSHGANTPRFSHGTPPRSRQAQVPPAQPSQPAPAPFLSPTTPEPPVYFPTKANQDPSYSSPQPIPHPLQQPVQPPSRSYQLPVDPAPAADDAWGTYTNQFTSGSDTPPLPPPNLRITARPNWEPTPALSQSVQHSYTSFWTNPIPSPQFRDFAAMMSGERFAPWANWQMPTRLLEDTLNTLRNAYSDPNSQTNLTWYGILSKQQSLHPDRQYYTEQTLTIPLPTNTADPERAILTSLFYAKMNSARSQMFTNSTVHPVQTTQAMLTEWLRFAGDQFRLSLNQTGVAQKFNYDVAMVILDLIDANIHESQRSYANDVDRNIFYDEQQGHLSFRQ